MESSQTLSDYLTCGKYFLVVIQIFFSSTDDRILFGQEFVLFD